MGRKALVLAALIAAQALLGSGPAAAAEPDPHGESASEVRGMVILRWPFGGDSILSAPRMGFDFHMRNRSDFDYLKQSYDPETGRRLPEVDAGSMRTWPLDSPEVVLPDETPGERAPDRQRPGSARLG
jgi:hypothetical protein